MISTINKMIAFMMLLVLSFSALAQWQDGNYIGELNWQGTVTHNRNPWSWAQGNLESPLDISPTSAQIQSGEVVWNNLMASTILLVGKTDSLMPSGRPGVIPDIRLGNGTSNFSIAWSAGGIAKVGLDVVGIRNGQPVNGRLIFDIRVSGGIIASQSGLRQGHAVVTGKNEGGNALPPPGLAGTYSSTASRLVSILGENSPIWLANRVAEGSELPFSEMASPQRQAVGGVYAAEIVPGSGVLSFQGMHVPEHWKASLPVQITYK